MLNSMETHKQRALFQRRNIAPLPISRLSESFRQWGCDPEKTKNWNAINPAGVRSADKEATAFYATNHVVALIGLKNPNGPLSDVDAALVDTYATQGAGMAMRAAAYVYLITTREARHFPSQCVSTLKTTPAMKDWLSKFVCGKSWNSVVHRLMVSPPGAMTTHEYVSGIYQVFKHPHWSGKSTAFGGDKWANVAKALYDFVSGAYSPEMFLDTVWTLQHNGGPIFNKSMLYSGYNHKVLVDTLNLQAQGALPYNLLKGTISYPGTGLKKYLELAALEHPELKEKPSGGGKLSKYDKPKKTVPVTASDGPEYLDDGDDNVLMTDEDWGLSDDAVTKKLGMKSQKKVRKNGKK